MKKSYCIIANLLLLGWFFLDMIGVYFGDKYLVTRSYHEDGIFFICFLTALLLFLFKERIGKYVLSIWLFMWLITQFFSHEWVTLFGNGEGKISYFRNAIHWIDSSSRYIPDVYHTILHLLIIVALVVTLHYCFYKKSLKKEDIS